MTNYNIYGVLTSLGWNAFIPRGTKTAQRSIVLKAKTFPPGENIFQRFTFGRYVANHFVITGRKGKFKAYISRHHFTVIANSDTMKCFIVNGWMLTNSEVIPTKNSLLQIKHSNEQRWISVPVGRIAALKEKTIVHIRGLKFLFTSNKHIQARDTNDHNNDLKYLYIKDGEQNFKFDNCEHKVDFETLQFWLHSALPFTKNSFENACPICLMRLYGQPGYTEIP